MMRRRCVGWGAALFCAGLAAMPVQAQRAPTPSTVTDNLRGTPDMNGAVEGLRQRGLLRPDMDTPDGFRSYSQLLVTGRCLAGLGRKGFTAAFDEGLNSAQERQQVAILQTRMASCLPAFSPNVASLVRGSISESLYHRDGEKRVKPLSPEQVVAFETAQRARFTSLQASDRNLAMVADCLVAREPMQARTVLGTEHGSHAEASAMDALFAGAPQCASAKRPQGISRPYLRAFIANSAFRLSRWTDAAEKAS